jgi:GNAT superfamily N-acetyltransferase
VQVRRATPDDLDVLVVLAAEYCASDGHHFDPATVLAGLRPLLADDRLGVVWVADVGGTIDGYAAVTWGWSIEIGGLDVVLDEIYVRTRGRGTGSALLERLEIDCRERGVRRIFLETEQPNDAARRLYARRGYTADTSIWMAKVL